MNLTSDYSTIRLARSGTNPSIRTAIPHRSCPNPKCAFHLEGKGLDWHTEWCTLPNQALLYNSEAAIDCPGCGVAVLVPENNAVEPNTTGVPLVTRSRAQAIKYLRSQLQTTLDQYLNTETGAPYRHYVFGA